MEKSFFENKKNKCSLLVVNKKKSFDQSFKGDFNLENNLISRKNRDDLNYIYTGLQVIKPEVFSDLDARVFSINRIWDKLIETNELHGIESNIDFLHVSTLDIYKSLLEKNLNIK
jgi:MurNAc alpha-1-phosphate uridylyltransferase